MTQTTLINLHPNEYVQGFCYYQLAVNIDRCIGNCNSYNNLSNEVYVPNKTEYLNPSVFNMITEKNESKTFAKYVSFKYECKFDGKKYDSNQKLNNDKSWYERKNPKEHNMCGK